MLQHHMVALGHLGLFPHDTRPAQRLLDNGEPVVVAGGTANSGFWVKLDSVESGHDLELLHTRSRNNGVFRWSERPEGQKLSSLSMTRG